MAHSYVTGIDVGTYHVKVVIAREPETKDGKSLPQIIGTGYAESRGLRNGYIINENDVRIAHERFMIELECAFDIAQAL